MTQLEGILLNLLHDKALLKQEVIGGAHEKFNMFKKLMAEDVAYMNNFLSELEVMNLEQRNLAVYRSAMRENKPKNWKIVEELLSIVIK